MPMLTEIPAEQWKSLYEAAFAFAGLEPWKNVLDSQLFGIRDAAAGRTGYCCVMGNLGDFFGLGIYKGESGLKSYHEIQLTADDLDEDSGPQDYMFEQDCWMISFEPFDALAEEDKDLLKHLGIQVPDMNFVPVFRDYSAGLYPWVLEKADAAFVETAIREATEVCTRAKTDRELLGTENGPDAEMLIRVSENGTWTDQHEKPNLSFQFRATKLEIPKMLVANAASKYPVKPGVVLFEHFYVPSPAEPEEGGRPFYPKALLLLDMHSQMIVNMDLTPLDEMEQAIPHAFLKTVENLGFIPAQVVVSNADNYKMLREFARLMDMEIHFDQDLNVLPEVKTELFEMMGLM